MPNLNPDTITILVNLIGIVLIGWRVEHRMTKIETLFNAILKNCPYYCNLGA